MRKRSSANLCAALARVNVSVFCQPLTSPSGLGLLASAPRRFSLSVGQRVARSLPERWPAVLPRGEDVHSRSKAINSRTAATVPNLNRAFHLSALTHFQVHRRPVGMPWMWTLLYDFYENRMPTHGYAATREAAMAAFAKSWRRE